MKIVMDLSLSLLISFTVLSGFLSTRGAGEDGSANMLSGKVQIIVVVPTTASESYCSSTQLPMWERGDEILPGAFFAEDEINNDLTLKWMMPEVEVVPIKVPRCDINTRIDRFVGNLTSASSNVVAVVGYFCDNMAYYFSQIVGHGRYGAVQISATSPLVPRTRDSLKVSHFYQILPSASLLAEAAVMLIRALNWSRIGIINQGLYHDKHFTRIKEEFLSYARQYNITTVFHIEHNVFNTPREILKELRNSTAKIVVVFLPPFEAMELICEAYQAGLRWPDYAWIYIETNGADLVSESKSCTANRMVIAMDKVILINFDMSQVGRENESIVSGRKYSHFYDKYIMKVKELSKNNCLQMQSNPYANLMYDSVWAIAIAMNRSYANFNLWDGKSTVNTIDEELSQLSFSGASGFVNFSQSASAVHPPVDIYQGLNVLIDSYNTRYGTVMVNQSILGKIPDDELDIVYQLYPKYLTAILLAFSIISFIFTTATMSLYIHYRKNPEIKASSSLLSLCMFIGCYGLVISSLLHTVASGCVSHGKVLGYAICTGNTALFNVGLDIIMATVCAKTIRIYRIFTSMSRLGHKWSDKSLFAVIVLVVSGKLLLMIIWAAVDTNHLLNVRTTSFNSIPPHYVIVQKCHSEQLGLWVGLAFGYTIILFVPMIISAVLTRRIDKDPFKDSKKICGLVAFLFVLVFIGSTLWFMLRNIGANIASKVIYSVGFTLAALACQIFLFLPKIVPSIRRHMDILKTTWVDSSVSYSAGYVQAHSDHNYHLL